MLNLIPVLLLLLFAALIQFLGKYKLSIGNTWLVTAGCALIVWVSMIVIRITMPSGLVITDWNPLQITSDPLIFQFSTRTWLFGFLLVSFFVGVIFTDTVRFGQGKNLTTWTGSMVLTAFGLFSILSQSFLAVILSWSVIDLVEIGILIRIADQKSVYYAAINEFLFRLIGILLLISALVFTEVHDQTISATMLSQTSFTLILIGSVLRLGVLPLHVPLTANLPVRRSLGTVLRFSAPLCVISFLTQVQSVAVSDTVFMVIFLLALSTVLFGAIKWYAARNELIGRPYWMLSFSGMVIIAFLRGQIESMVGLSVIMVICGGIVFLHSSYGKGLKVFIPLLILGMIGLPYTPVNSIWAGLLSAPISGVNFILIISLAVLFSGLIKHLTRIDKSDQHIEQWMQILFFAGLIFLVLSPWVTLFWHFADIQNMSYWYAPVICLVLIGALFILRTTKFGQKLIMKPVVQKVFEPAGYFGSILNNILKFDWFFDFIKRVYGFFSQLTTFILRILEGDGGLLWGFLFLALLSSVIIGVSNP